MERDFMGLRNRQTQRRAKPIVQDEYGLNKSSGVEWAKFYAPPNSLAAPKFHDARLIPANYQPANVLPRNHFSGQNQNAGVAANALGMTPPSPLLPTLNSSVGFADPRNNAASSAPQLTIFYGGTVSVFNDIPLGKAQALMLWAGNGLTLSPPIETPKVPTREMNSKPAGEGERVYGKRGQHASPNAVAAVSVSSSSGTHADSVSVGTENPVTSRAIDLMGSFCMIPSVPQARKASLTRFLEKRKERLMNATPYNMSKMNLMECSTGESTGMNYSATSAA